MKRYGILLFTFIFGITVLAVNSSTAMDWDDSWPTEITFDTIPETVEEFIEMRNELSVTPTGAAAMFVVAMLVYGNDQDEGLKCFIVALENNEWLVDSSKGYMDKSLNYNANYLVEQIDDQLYLGNTYIIGTSADDGYELPDAPYTIKFTTNPYCFIYDDYMKMFVECSGASSARPITLAQNTRGIWKVHEFSSLVIGVMSPAVTDDGDDI